MYEGGNSATSRGNKEDLQKKDEVHERKTCNLPISSESGPAGPLVHRL
jgi:hypothetical protein